MRMSVAKQHQPEPLLRASDRISNFETETVDIVLVAEREGADLAEAREKAEKSEEDAGHQ